jgi:hypothetical protein
MSKCEHGLTSRECFVCASPKRGAYPPASPPTDALPTRDQIRELVKESGLDWHRGFVPLFDGDDTNRYEVLVRAAFAAQAEAHASAIANVTAAYRSASALATDEMKRNDALRAERDAQQALIRRCLESMRHAVQWEETGQGRPPSQTCLFEIQDAQKALDAARTGGKA